MARIELRDISKHFGDVSALESVSLDIEDNEFFCVFGPPSTGKTTLLRMILGLEFPDNGELLIDGHSVTDIAPAARNLAMVFQNLALFPHMTAGENLRFPLEERRVPADQRDRIIGDVADKLHIKPLLNKMPAQLSGGEKQRVAIGRALVRDSHALLMDEPISALDARLREEMRVELKRLQRDLGRTLVYVTHDQEEAMSVADRLCIMGAGGAVAQVGAPQEIYSRPVSRYVAELIGSPPINLVDGSVAPGSGGLFTGRGTPLRARFSVEEDWNGAAQIGIRPEDIAIRTEPDSGLAAQVFEVEPLGAFTIIDIQFGDYVIKAQVRGQPRLRLEQPIWLAINFAKAHLFCDSTSKRVATGATQAD